MDDGIKKLQETFGEQRIRSNEPLSAHTLLKIGGPAAYYLEVDKIEELTKVAKIARESEIPIYVIGTGSSTLLTDSGIQGLIVKNNCRKFDVISRKGKIRNNTINVDRVYVYADSGVLMNQLVRFTIEQNLSGLEQHLGASGTIGGNLYRNTKENEILNDYIYQIQVLDSKGNTKLVDRNDLLYTDKKGNTKKADYIILSVLFELFPSGKEILWDKGTSALEKRQSERPQNQMSLYVFQDISMADAMRIPTPGYATAAAYLLEKANIKGKKFGDASFSETYANYIITGNAQADDIITLIKLAREEVHKKIGVWLSPVCTIITHE